MNNSALDEFDLAGLKLTEEQKIQFRKFDTDIIKIANLLGENKTFGRRESKPRTKMWGKNRFYE
ncbi:TPA: hypothetical protein LA751_001583 [Clostridium botulinum]|nr:hypothetical protein [Clostridium botulinum]